MLRESCGEYDVVLIRKNKPDWQRGKLNGIGGKVEHGETIRRAMQREFEEETGCWTSQNDWRQVAVLSYSDKNGQGDHATIFFFEMRDEHWNRKIETKTDEKVDWYDVNAIITSPTIVPNLRWLIPLALEGDVTVKNL